MNRRLISSTQFNVPCYKIASASLTDDGLLRHTRAKGHPILLSTGMSTLEQIDHAVEVLGKRGSGHSAYHQHLPGSCMKNSICGSSRCCTSAMACRSGIPDTKPGFPHRLLPWRWALAWWNVILRLTVPCGAPTRPPLSNRRVSPTWSVISAWSKLPWAMASSASIEREVPIMKKLRRVDTQGNGS